MEALQFHQQPHLPMFLTPNSFSINFRATTSLYFRSMFSKCFSASFSSLTTPTSATTRKGRGEIRARTTGVSSVVADVLKENWLASLTCPPFVPETENPLMKFEEGLGDREVSLRNVGSQWVIGIDPDVSGALAVLKTNDTGSSAQVFDSPNLKVLVGKRIRRRLDTNALVQLLLSFEAPAGTTAYIEQSLPYPSDGKQGWWSAGFNYGLWIGVLVASKFSVVPVPSARWKNEFKLAGNGSTKNDSREMACNLFPSLSSSLKRKKDHGRAEALLIAAYGKGIKWTSLGTDISTN